MTSYKLHNSCCYFLLTAKKKSTIKSSEGGPSIDHRGKPPPYSEMADSKGKNMLLFWIAVGLSQAVGIVCVGLVVYYCTLKGGFGWTDPDKQFFYHPFLMVLGFVFFYGDAILIYRVLYFLPKWILKLIHAILHISAIVMASVGLTAVFENHRRTNKNDLYSLHSWVGIGTFGFFYLQYIFSFVAFLFPGLPPVYRAKIMPFHTFFGLALFLLAVATAEMGLAEYLAWTSVHANVANSLGLFMIVFACLVVFITTHSEYKRKPIPSDAVAPRN